MATWTWWWQTTAMRRCCCTTPEAWGNHFVSLKLVGTRSNRDALGARITLRAGGMSQIREISAGGSFSSHSDLRAHFGLGDSVRIDSIEIRWPSGAGKRCAMCRGIVLCHRGGQGRVGSRIVVLALTLQPSPEPHSLAVTVLWKKGLSTRSLARAARKVSLVLPSRDRKGASPHAATAAGSSTLRNRSAATFVNCCTAPRGQRISMELTCFSAPRPK